MLSTQGDAAHRNVMRGLALAIVLGAVLLAGAALAALAAIYAVTGWGPSFLENESPIDFLYGGGGMFVNFLTFMGGSMAALLSLATITWGFTGEFDLDRFS